MAVEWNYTAFRHAAWGGSSGNVTVTILGEDLSGATFDWIIADEEGGAAEITLSNAIAGSEGVSAVYDSTVVDDSGAEVGATIITPQIDQATFEALTDPTPDATADYDWFHTFYITPAGEPRYVHHYGNFTIRQGAPG